MIPLINKMDAYYRGMLLVQKLKREQEIIIPKGFAGAGTKQVIDLPEGFAGANTTVKKNDSKDS